MFPHRMLLLFMTLCILVWAETKSMDNLFQEALFIEETEGDMEKAILKYEEILSRAKRDTTSNEEEKQLLSRTEYQLGICYLKQGNKEQAITQFKKIITAGHAHDEVLNKTRNYLEKINPEFCEKPAEIAFLKAPWGTYEECRYKVYTQNGGEIGESLIAIEETEKGNSTSSVISCKELIPTDAYTRKAVLHCEPKSFTPISCSVTVANLWNWHARFDGSSIKYTSNMPNKNTENSTTYSQQIFDYEQVRHMVRRLPLEVGYQDSALIFTTTSGMHSKGQLKILGMEQIETPMGSFNCFKAAVSASLQGDQNYTQTLWISADEHRYVVQTKSGKLTDKLVTVEVQKPTAGQIVQGDSIDILMELPHGYDYYHSLTTMQFETLYQIFSPKTMAWTVLASKKKAPNLSNIEYVKQEAKMYKEWWKKFSVRKNSLREITINGIPAVQEIVDVRFNAKNPPITEYRTYFFTDEKVHCLIIRTNKDDLLKFKADFDTLVESVKRS